MTRKPLNLNSEFPDDTAVIEWLESLRDKKSTFYTYKNHIQKFLAWTNMKGIEIIEDRKQDKEHKWEKKILEFRQYLLDQKFSENTAKTIVGCVRGFFAYHYQDLKFRRTVRVKLKKAVRVTEDYRFSRKDLEKMANVANIRDRYILVVGKSLGFRASDFIKLRVGDFTSLDLELEAPISMGKISTTKETVDAYPFLDSDAVEVVKAYLLTMKDPDPDQRMIKIRKEQLSTVLQKLHHKAQLQNGTKIVRFHCLRKFLIDHLSAVTSESKWKQIVGKAISEGAYVSTVELKEAYKRAMPQTCFGNGNIKTKRIQDLEKAVIQLQKDTSTYKTINEEMMQSHLKQSEHMRNLVTLLKQIPFPEKTKKIIEKLEKEAKKH